MHRQYMQILFQKLQRLSYIRQTEPAGGLREINMVEHLPGKAESWILIREESMSRKWAEWCSS